MASFDVVSLFTNLLIENTIDLLGRHFDESIIGIFRHVVTNSYFTFNGQFYGQSDCVAMGSPLSPVVGSFYMED
jgi:hypothetical protein